MKIATFLVKNGNLPKLVADFLWERDTFRKQNHGNRRGFRRKKLQQQRQTLENVEGFACEDKTFKIFTDFAFFIFFIFHHFLIIFHIFFNFPQNLCLFVYFLNVSSFFIIFVDFSSCF